MIIPTLFAENKEEFKKRFEKLIFAKNLHIDIMSGKFVKAKSISLSQIPNLKKYKINFEAHLMIQNPLPLIKKLKQKGFNKIIFHIESKNTEKTLSLIKQNKLFSFIAINPETKLEKILPYLSKVNGVLFMGVHPGKEHQKFIPSVYKKISQLRKLNKKIKIQVDGGANDKTIPKLARHGVNNINVGSYISNSEAPRETLKKLNDLSANNH